MGNKTLNEISSFLLLKRKQTFCSESALIVHSNKHCIVIGVLGSNVGVSVEKAAKMVPDRRQSKGGSCTFEGPDRCHIAAEKHQTVNTAQLLKHLFFTSYNSVHLHQSPHTLLPSNIALHRSLTTHNTHFTSPCLTGTKLPRLAARPVAALLALVRPSSRERAL